MRKARVNDVRRLHPPPELHDVARDLTEARRTFAEPEFIHDLKARPLDVRGKVLPHSRRRISQKERLASLKAPSALLGRKAPARVAAKQDGVAEFSQSNRVAQRQFSGPRHLGIRQEHQNFHADPL